MKVNGGGYLPSCKKQRSKYPPRPLSWIIYVVYTIQNQRQQFIFENIPKLSEIKLLTHKFVSSAAWTWIVLADGLQTSQPGHVKDAIRMCDIY